jgi:hypothetical protein
MWSTYTFGTYQGSIIAFVLMTPLALFVNTLCLAFYNWSKKDWFGFEAIKEFEANAKEGGAFRRFLYALLTSNRIAAFFVLSIFGDPFLTVVYLRKKDAQYTKLTTRDQYVLISSALVSNAYWTLRWTVLIEVLKAAWQWIEPLRIYIHQADFYKLLTSF